MNISRNHPQVMGTRFGEVLFSQWMELERLRKVVLKRKATKDIHDLRVASRRIRATLALIAPFIRERLLKQLGRKLRRFTSELGQLRNIDEALIYFAPHETTLPGLIRALVAARKRELRLVLQNLKQFSTSEIDQMFRLVVEDLTGHTQLYELDSIMPAYLSQTAVTRFQELYNLLPSAVDPENWATRHDLRIAVKKWRYLLESMSQIFSHNYQDALDLLKEYQSILGRLNDMTEFKALCDRMKLTDDEKTQQDLLLENDTAMYLDRFLIMVESRRPKYTFQNIWSPAQ